MIKRFDLHINTAQLGVLKVAEVALLEADGRLQETGFRYSADYLAHPAAFAIDPVCLPLRPGEFRLLCHSAAPAFIDDYLPDAWGRKVLTRLALHQHQQRLNANCVSDMLGFLQQVSSRIGALCFTATGQAPVYHEGLSLEQLVPVEQLACQLDQQAYSQLAGEAASLLYLANSGSGVGGARPKALVQDQGVAYLAKFNRATDPYNNARTELACLLMAQAAGISMGNGRVVSGINGREVLLLERFDVRGAARRHLITANGLLKDPRSQQDPGQSFSYNDLHRLLQKYSCAIEDDLQQLIRLMLFNRCINNTDDHERNFSFMHDGCGYRLAPAYDLVPGMNPGDYHAAGFDYRPWPPGLQEAARLRQLFGVPAGVVAEIVEQLHAALKRWPEFAAAAGMSGEDAQRVGQVIRMD